MAVILGSVYDYRTDLCYETISSTGAIQTTCAASTFDYLTSASAVVTHYSVMGVSIPFLNTDWIGTLMQTLTLQFSFIQGQWLIFWILVCAPLVAGSVFAFATWSIQMFQGFIP